MIRIKAFITGLVFLANIFCAPSFAAIATAGTPFDQSGAGTGASNTETINTGANLMVGMEIELVSTGGSDCFTNASIGGVNYTGLIKRPSTATANGYTYFLWWFAPPNGSQTVASAFSCNVNFSQRTAMYSGVAAQAPVTDNTSTSAANVTFNTADVTPCASGSWLVGTMENSAASITAGTGTFFRVGSPNGDGLFDSNGTVSGASHLQGTSSSHPWTGLVASFSPSVCGAAQTAQKTLMGVGK